MSMFTRESTGLEQVEAQVEGEIREFVRRDFAGARRPAAAPERGEAETVASNIGSLLQRVSLSSVQEIDRLISDLTQLRARLHQEGERVQRQIVEYASLSQAAMQSTKIIADSLNHWRRTPDAPRLDEGA
jgi:chemotaxis protein histidine kinase CheA